MMVKIMLACIVNRNFGDSVIADNTDFLLKQVQRTLPFREIKIIPYNILLRDSSIIPYFDAIIFAGGGLIKYKKEAFHEIIPEMIEIAQEHNIPVFFNSVGVEGYDEEDERCRNIKKMVNSPCIKGFSIRDDERLFRDQYMENRNVHITPVFDPAICCRNTYKDITSEKTDYIGLGVAREDLFIDYGTEAIDRAFLLEFWKKLALELESRGMKWKIFTNGAAADEAFAEEVLEYIGHGEKIPMPLSSREIIANIRQFRGIIACRMHTNIIAYSFGIPSIGLVWNQKLAFWGRRIGYPERFLTPDQMQAGYAADCLCAAIKAGCRNVPFRAKYQLFRELRWFVKNYCVSREHTHEKIDLKKHMMAAALGTKDLKYKNMNTLQSLEESWKQGYRNIEVDIRLTKDGDLVCINGWSSQSFALLGVKNYVEYEPMTTEEFLSKKYYGRFPTATFRQLLSKYESGSFFNKIKLIIDIGKPKEEDCKRIMEQLSVLREEYPLDKDKVIVRLQTKKHVEMYKAFGLPYPIAYEFTAKTELYDKDIEYCKKKKIKWISITAQNYTDNAAEYLSENGMKTIVLSYNKPGEMIQAIEKGAALVGSLTYPVCYLEEMIRCE